MTNRWSSDELKAKQQGQNAVMHKINTEILIRTGGDKWTHIHGEQDLQNADVRRGTDYLIANSDKIAAQAAQIAQEIVSAM